MRCAKGRGDCPPEGGSPNLLRGGLREVACLYYCEPGRIDVAPHRFQYLIRRYGGYLFLKVGVPGKGSVQEEIREEPVYQFLVLRAAELARLQVARFRGCYFLGGKPVFQRSCDLLLECRLYFGCILGGVDRISAEPSIL